MHICTSTQGEKKEYGEWRDKRRIERNKEEWIKSKIVLRGEYKKKEKRKHDRILGENRKKVIKTDYREGIEWKKLW